MSGRGTCLGGQSKRNSLAVTEVIDTCHLNAITAGNLTGQSRHSIYLTVWLIPFVHVMTSLAVTSPFFAHSLLWVKADTCFEVWDSSLHSQDQHGWFFSVDIANDITPNTSLPDLNCHLSQVYHSSVCQRMFRQRRPSSWNNSVTDQLRELKCECPRAERRWRSSRLTIQIQLYDTAEQKVIVLVHDTKTSF